MSRKPEPTLSRTLPVGFGQKPGETGHALKYRPEHCETVRALAQEGAFPEEWAAALGVTFQTMRNWVGAYPEFREAMVVARHLFNAHWAKVARAKIESPTLKVGVLDRILTRRIRELWSEDAPPLWQALGLTGEEEVRDPAQIARGLTDRALEERLAQMDRLKARRQVEEG